MVQILNTLLSFFFVRNQTHKNDVIRFALEMADECRKSTDITDKESAALLWDLMVLLCRQNGVSYTGFDMVLYVYC